MPTESNNETIFGVPFAAMRRTMELAGNRNGIDLRDAPREVVHEFAKFRYLIALGIANGRYPDGKPDLPAEALLEVVGMIHAEASVMAVECMWAYYAPADAES